ncbi:hypothetical protein ACP70R_037952 [Stipagrostis hirtigluma subsp. patula]
MAGDSLKFHVLYTILFCLSTMSYGTPADTNCDAIWEVIAVVQPKIFVIDDADGLLHAVLSPPDNLDQQLNDNSGATFRLTVLHREHPCSPASPRPVDHSSPSSLSRYHARARRLAGRLSSCPADGANVSGGAIVANGVPWDCYSYVTRIQLGTPARTHSVLVDTGSSLSWITCKPCKKGCDEAVDPLFDPAASSSYNVIRCRSSLCNIVPAATTSPATCFMPFQSCSYKQTYEDNSTSQGVASIDRLVYGKGTTEAFVFGCTNAFSGLGGRYSGIIGLSANSLSFFSQLSLGCYKAMSYCLPHPRKAGFLQFGRYEQQDGLRFTPLFVDGNHFYVHSTGISVGNVRLDVPPGTGENKTMRCFFDTGTPYTMLPGPLFESLSDAVEKRIQGFYRVGAWTGQTCFERDVSWNEEDVYVPAVRIAFQGSARITLVADDLWFLEGSGLVCLAFKRNAGDDVVLGSRHLMAVHTVVDLEKSMVGLWDRGCT